MRLSILNLVEIVVAYAVILLADRFTHLVMGWDAGFVIFLGLLYPFKILLAIAGRTNKRLSVIAYASVMTAALAWPISRYWSDWTWAGIFICVPVVFLTVPSISFVIDLTSTQLPSPRFLIWRSLTEIVFIYPPWLYTSIWITIFLGGWRVRI